MDTRREFLKKAAALSGGAGLFSTLPPSIQKALAIDPDKGSSFMDAEHIVVLMQENRSFDHAYGTLQGVRGFNDPRAISLPDKNLVWLQTNAAGETYAPFRLNIKDTNSTWLGDLPHSWTDQVDALNKGKYDQWLIAKPSRNKAFASAPLTLGYYNREDLPFYYSLADAFTICDQNFCSSLTGTTPNRLYLWTGAIRDKPNASAYAHVRNDDVTYQKEASWTTFPERLEENNISWKIYQNEISLDTGLSAEQEAWLVNFTNNPIEWFSQYHVRFSPEHFEFLQKSRETLGNEIEKLKASLASADNDGKIKKIREKISQKEELLDKVISESVKWSPENFDKLSTFHKNIHRKAFANNRRDPHYRELENFTYDDNGVKRKLKLPKSDILFQFREDVRQGALPAVSWLIAPKNFSDHPAAPWYGAWYISEVLDILTRNPEVWKKTIFILCYDENDGYYDHVPPFVTPDPDREGTGRVSPGINGSAEQVPLEQDLKSRPPRFARGGPIGLGFRVPLVIASPWSRGGRVCSQVFDHTSILQLMEKVLSKKTNKKIEEPNISSWRRAVCGDLSSVFTPYRGEKIIFPESLERAGVIENIHKAQFKEAPFGYRPLTAEEKTAINRDPYASPLMPRQEKGVRPSCALPYELYVEGRLNKLTKNVEILFKASNEAFGEASAGAAFNVYAPGRYLSPEKNENRVYDSVRTWAYAAAAGEQAADQWPLDHFEHGQYHLRVYGPNGFYREFTGDENDPDLTVELEYERERRNPGKLTGNIALKLVNLNPSRSYEIVITDNAYQGGTRSRTLKKSSSPRSRATVGIPLDRSAGWYDLSVSVTGSAVFEKRYAGRVETGRPGITDPAMGNR
ncbi:MAG TPA: phospholipase C, phosphocholine-specific [Flavitalea sp.]|nr:phospholipase C, phosphocholine-specific [Flavitalea sp.]